METKEILCDYSNKDITDDEQTSILFKLFIEPKVDLCRHCSKLFYKLIKKKKANRK